MEPADHRTRSARGPVMSMVVTVLLACFLAACSVTEAADDGTSLDDDVRPTDLAPDVSAEPPGADADNVDDRNPYGWFEADQEWRGDFGDPFVVPLGGTYIAYSSATAGRYLPVVTSTDLRRWVARGRWTSASPPWLNGPDPTTDPSIPVEIRTSDLRLGAPGDVWNHNDALVAPAAWGREEPVGPWLRRTIWAPSVARIGDTWVLYYSVRVSPDSDDPNGDGRFCISRATAPEPTGPFRDASAGPLVCDDDPAGSIDPEPFFDPTVGRWYLLWKAAGRVGSHPSALKAVELDGSGVPVAGATPVTLLETDESSWEGETIENPSMAHWRGRHVLVYSGNAWRADAQGSSRYATGWAECSDGPRGPCRRGAQHPLLASNGPEQGPAGGSLFAGPDDRLFLAYCAFDSRDARDPRPRRLRVAEVGQLDDGTLRLTPIS